MGGARFTGDDGLAWVSIGEALGTDVEMLGSGGIALGPALAGFSGLLPKAGGSVLGLVTGGANTGAAWSSSSVSISDSERSPRSTDASGLV